MPSQKLKRKEELTATLTETQNGGPVGSSVRKYACAAFLKTIYFEYVGKGGLLANTLQ